MNKILVVDDEEPIRMLYDYELTEEGYKVFTLGEGSRLLEIVEHTRPDLIVLDIRLGEWSGLDLLQDIRNTVYNMPVILCTAYPELKYDLRAIAADYFVIKRSDLKELKNKIKMALEGNRLFLRKQELAVCNKNEFLSKSSRKNNFNLFASPKQGRSFMTGDVSYVKEVKDGSQFPDFSASKQRESTLEVNRRF